mgnify:FL=1
MQICILMFEPAHKSHPTLYNFYIPLRDDEGENSRTDVNNDGFKVYTLLQNFQGRKSLFDERGYKGKKLNCGDGWLRLLHFDLKKNQIQTQ